MRQSLSILAVLVALLTLGLWGQYELDPDRFASEFGHVLYQVVMLFVLEGDWTIQAELPWQLMVTRLVAPLASVAGVLLVLTRGAWVDITNSFVRYRQDHVVVAGLGPMALEFVSSSRAHHDVVVVERDTNNRYIDQVRSMGVAVIVGDVLDPHILHRINLKEARHLVTFTGNNGTNVEAAIKARSYLKARGLRSRLRIHLHLSDTRLSQRLEGYPKFFGDYQYAEINFFSVYDLNVRILLTRYPPERFADAFGQQQVHLALYEFGRMAEHILLEAVRLCHFRNGSSLRFTIFDNDDGSRENSLRANYPALGELCNITFMRVDLASVRDITDIPEDLLQSVTEHVVCCSSEEASLELALILRESLLARTACNAPIIVRMEQSNGLAQLLESNLGTPEIPDGLYPFGMQEESLSYENILSDGLDQLARVIHEDYVARTAEGRSASRSDWEYLPEPTRKSNRLQGDHLPVKLRAVSCVRRTGATPDFRLTDDEAERLAEMEHERWRANRLYAARIEDNPYAVAWAELDASEQRSEIEAIQRLPALLGERLGWGIAREHVIGVSGHRPGRLRSDETVLKQRIHDVLAEILARHPDCQPVLLSPLADGADRLFARVAMEDFGMALRVPLPLPWELYQDDFDAESREEFRALIGRAESYFELPMRFGTRKDLMTRPGGNEARNNQYALTGAWIVERSDSLVVIWDGEPAAGTGGTADVVAWRKSGDVPAALASPVTFFEARPQTAPIVIDP